MSMPHATSKATCASCAVGVLVVLLLATAPAAAQPLEPLSATQPDNTRVERESADGDADNVILTNPLSILDNASRALPFNGLTAPVESGDGTELSSSVVVPAGEQGGFSATISIVLLLTVLSLAPAILVMCTSFTRIIVVLALLRQAIGTQSLPPSQVIIGLALFMTLLVMAPTFKEINKHAIVPLQNGDITEETAWNRTTFELKRFMLTQINHAGNIESVLMIKEYRNHDISDPGAITVDDLDMITIIPAFILSELKVAFLMGFRLYLPFLIIDMVIASVLISMGMLMLPPVLISLPFKLLLFVLVDGWHLVAGSLLYSFAPVPGLTG
ncbi:MAG: flagellar type III secretion system pore protein FliP [Rhodospirillales bacterium]|nr:flagellar type III secretion system pore protein FliP [Rhodospirillales bacterium]